MHVDWGWIWQRPHVMAEGLAAAGHEVVVRYEHGWRTQQLRSHERSTVRTAALPSLPLGRYRVSRELTSAARRIALGRAAFEPDLVWLTFPTLVDDLPRAHRRLPLVYDAMDVAPAIYWNQADRPRVEALERRVCQQAALVLASSGHLVEHVAAVSGARALLVRNGHSATLAPEPTVAVTGTVRALYVGTVSSWFDVDTVVRALDARPALSLDLVGPVDAVTLPDHPRIRHLGVRDHAELADLAASYDLLVMPFVVNDVILGVDPVKLYEYVAWRRPVVTVDYPEVARFGGLVNRYTTVDELCALVDRAAGGDPTLLPDRAASTEFLAENTWGSRVDTVTAALAAWA